MGVARLGALVNFISHTVIVGFTAGAGLLIIAAQLKNFFGVRVPGDANFFEILHEFFHNVATVDPSITATGDRHARRRGGCQADVAARSVHDRRDGGRWRLCLRARARGIRQRAHRGGASVRLADAVVAFLRSRSVAQARSGGARIDGARADRSGIDRARHRGENRTAHRRQSGVHRPGPVQHRRRVHVGLPRPPDRSIGAA